MAGEKRSEEGPRFILFLVMTSNLLVHQHGRLTDVKFDYHNLGSSFHLILNTRLLTYYVLYGSVQVRKVDMLEGVSVVRSEKVKDELVLDGNDIELVSRSAALINQVLPLFLTLYIVKYPFLALHASVDSPLCLICCNRNATLRRKTSGNSSTVSTSTRREQ